MLSVSDDVKLVISALFSSAWRIMTSFQIPGTNINIAEFLFACLAILFSYRVVPHMLGLHSWWSDHAEPGESFSDRVRMSFQKRSRKY